MTPKMATDKVNAPAVSQLAGEIARKIDSELITEHGETAINFEERVAALISAALSEREEKVEDLFGAAQEAKRTLRRLESVLYPPEKAQLAGLESILAALGE